MAETEQKEISYDIYQPFGPSILKTKLPEIYLEQIIQLSDKLLGNEKLSKEGWELVT